MVLRIALEGLVRNAGTHAGGVVIAPSVLTDFAPLYCEAGGGSVVTQFDKDDVEAAGLVKFDFLGLRTLTIIDRAVRIINAQRAAAGELTDVKTLIGLMWLQKWRVGLWRLDWVGAENAIPGR